MFSTLQIRHHEAWEKLRGHLSKTLPLLAEWHNKENGMLLLKIIYE